MLHNIANPEQMLIGVISSNGSTWCLLREIFGYERVACQITDIILSPSTTNWAHTMKIGGLLSEFLQDNNYFHLG